MQLVTQDGRVYSGEQALPPLMDLMTGWRWLARILRLPGIRHASPAAYRWFASTATPSRPAESVGATQPADNNGGQKRDEREKCE